MIDRIEFSVERSHNYVKEAGKQVVIARKYQSKARHVREPEIHVLLPLTPVMAIENDLLRRDNCGLDCGHCDHCSSVGVGEGEERAQLQWRSGCRHVVRSTENISELKDNEVYSARSWQQRRRMACLVQGMPNTRGA